MDPSHLLQYGHLKNPKNKLNIPQKIYHPKKGVWRMRQVFFLDPYEDAWQNAVQNSCCYLQTKAVKYSFNYYMQVYMCSQPYCTT